MVGPKYPLFVLGRQEAILHVHSDDRLLRITTPKGAKDRLLCGMDILDREGQWYKVESFEVVRQPFWKRPRTPFGRGVCLTNLQFRHIGSADLDEAKAMLKQLVEARRESWESGVGFDMKQFFSEVDGARSFGDLLQVVAPELREEMASKGI